MIQTSFEKRIKVQDIVSNQLPEFILSESPKTVDFLKQYYISQEYQTSPVDISNNLDQYLDLDNLTPEVIVGSTNLADNLSETDTIITITSSTKGFPSEYGLIKIDNEIITYTGTTTNSFTGCVRGFSGITNYAHDLNNEELVFESTKASSHSSGDTVENLSSLFFKELYKKYKYTFAPGLHETNLNTSLDIGSFLKQISSFYKSKGSDESFRILFQILFGEKADVINLENYLLKSSYSEYSRREICVARAISGNPLTLKGQSLFNNSNNIEASISNVEIFTRSNINYYKFSLFVGYDQQSDVRGIFDTTPVTKCVEQVNSGDTIITVDSTIGFNKTGTIQIGSNTVNYTDKTINQFFLDAPISIETSIEKTEDVIQPSLLYYGYENGDTTKKVELIFEGVLDKFSSNTSSSIDIEDPLTIRNFGTTVKDDEINPRKKSLANSWLYNTSSSFDIINIPEDETITATLRLAFAPEVSNLKKGDFVEIVYKDNPSKVIYPVDGVYPYVNDTVTRDVSLADLGTEGSDLIRQGLNSNSTVQVRRVLNKAVASENSIPLKYGNNKINSDIQNVYFDKDYAFVASNGLPSGSIRSDISPDSLSFNKNINAKVNKSTVGILTNFDDSKQVFNAVKFKSNHRFIDGDKVVYEYSGSPIVGLSSGSYYIETVGLDVVKLHLTNNTIGSDNNIKFTTQVNTGSTHTLTYFNQTSNFVGVQKVFKKFPLEIDNYQVPEKTLPGKIGILKNGVEILNYKSDDKIYYGKLSSVEVLNGGSEFDVVNPPKLEVSVGAGNTAYIQPVVKGSVEKVLLSKNFTLDVQEIISTEITGGNGKNCVLDVTLKKDLREVLFNASTGINTDQNSILFDTDHGFVDGQEIFYNSNLNSGVGIVTTTSNPNPKTLINRASYIARTVNNKAIKIYRSRFDFDLDIREGRSVSDSNALVVSFNGDNLSGVHKFNSDISNQITEIKVLNGGEGFTNNKVIVNPVGISTIYNTITFNDHGYNNGELVEYSIASNLSTNSPVAISGLNVNNQYYVLKVNDNSFRLCDAGIGGTIKSNYDREEFVILKSSGSGYQQFNYPAIKANLTAICSGVGKTEIPLTPFVKGSIDKIHLYESGSGYGSEILNFEAKPFITVKTGKEASINPAVVNGQIIAVTIEYGGYDYFSTPELEVVDPNNDGIGALLVAKVENGKISSVEVIKKGIGYSSQTYIRVKSLGINLVTDPKVNQYTLINNIRFGNLSSGILKPESIITLNSDDGLNYLYLGYNPSLFDKETIDLQEDTPDSFVSSGIIGWAYDGNPIYGPYGYTNAEEFGGANNDVKRLISGYSISSKIGQNNTDKLRPSSFQGGYFVEDYEFTNSGDLDEYNGRFEKNQDFPNGAYVYHALVSESSSGRLPVFPYFIGDKFKSASITENFGQLDHSFDFNQSNLKRNILPYSTYTENSDYNFLTNIKDITNQNYNIKSTTEGSVSDISIIQPGVDYKVDEVLNFETNSDGYGVFAKVGSVKGIDVTSVKTTKSLYSNSTLLWGQKSDRLLVHTSSSHDFVDGDNVILSTSGINTALNSLNGKHIIELEEIQTVTLGSSLPATSNLDYINFDQTNASRVGFTTTITVFPLSLQILPDSEISIGTETLKVLEVNRNNDTLLVRRGQNDLSHTEGSSVVIKPNFFYIKNPSIDKFNSNLNLPVYFNAGEHVGFGTTPGSAGETGGSTDVLTQNIFVENHPFKTNQKVIYRDPTKFADDTNFNSTTKTLKYKENATDTTEKDLTGGTEVYIINNGPNNVGVATTPGGSAIFFTDLSGGQANGEYNDEYSFTSTFEQQKIDVLRLKTTVSVSTSHNLKNDDIVTLNIKPKNDVGIGTTSTEVFVTQHDGILGITSSTITSVSNHVFTVSNHILNTGDRVRYNSTSGSFAYVLEDSSTESFKDNSFYVHKLNDDTFNLCLTYADSIKNPPETLETSGSFTSGDYLTLVNPQIRVTNNNNLKFDLSDSTLSGYNFKFYYDKDFNNEFVSTGTTSGLNVVSVGNTILTLNHDSNLPTKLFYNLEKSGTISTTDTNTLNNNQILFVNSAFNEEFVISGVGNTTFNLFLSDYPESYSYLQSDCDVLEYTTKSTNVLGPINTINLISGGNNYKKLPEFVGTSSTVSNGAILSPVSDTIGKIKEITILDNGFGYSVDKTIEPEALLPRTLIVDNSNTIESVNIIDGGSGLVYPPQIIIVDSQTYEKIDSGILISELSDSGRISNIKIIDEPVGLPETPVTLRSINNTNGYVITKIDTSASATEFTCDIITPINGYNVDPFKVGDKVYVEGIEKQGTEGTGFNSEDYGYKFFEVQSISGTNPFQVTFNLADLGTSNTGSVSSTQTFQYGILIPEDQYPKFEVKQKIQEFENNEILLVNSFERDLRVISNNADSLKVIGRFDDLSIGDILTGKSTRSSAKIKKIITNFGEFSTNMFSRKNEGWETDTGKLNFDNQVISDNDYYQKLSYSVKSPVTWKKQNSFVNKLVHTSGLKNFADTEIQNKVNRSGITTQSSVLTPIVDLSSENRVDVIQHLDIVRDEDVLNSKSKFVEFGTKKLSNYIECKTNRVLVIDNIREKFSNAEVDADTYLNIRELQTGVTNFDNFIVKVSSNGYSDVHTQITEFITLSNGTDNMLFERSSLVGSGSSTLTFSDDKLVDFQIQKDEDTQKTYLRFVPVNAFDIDYDLKILRNRYYSTTSGIGSTSFGSVQLISSLNNVTASETKDIVGIAKTLTESAVVVSEVRQGSISQLVESYIVHDGENVGLSEYYVDAYGTSDESIGIHTASLEDNKLKIKFENKSNSSVEVRTRIVGLGTVSITNPSVYRFKSDFQPTSDVKSVIYQSFTDTVNNNVGVATILEQDYTEYDAAKTIVQIKSSGISTSSLYQVSCIHNGTDAFSQESQYILNDLSSSELTFGPGLGTFGSRITSSNKFVLEFYPSSNTGVTTFTAFNQLFHKEYDEDNTPNKLTYGKTEESVQLNFFNSVNGKRINRLDFDLKTTVDGISGIPIFAKSFNPDSSAGILNPITGVFTIPNHFFRTGEELIYTPKSTFDSIGVTSMTYKGESGGTDTLPASVFAIKTDEDTFQISTTRSYDVNGNIVVGSAVTFTSVGSGNAHVFEMAKSNTKTIISIDGITQYPLIFTDITKTLENNTGSQISDSDTTFSLSGISTVKVGNILKIDNEYMNITNVGVGTTSVGPITPGIGTFSLVTVERGSVGSSKSTHDDGSTARIFKGSYNIKESKIHFSEAPRGNPQGEELLSGLPFTRSSFSGRVFLRNNYSTNFVYDDISEEFDGITEDFKLSVEGSNPTTGIGTSGGNGFLLINGVFQTPITDNSKFNNFQIIESKIGSDYISTVRFSGSYVNESITDVKSVDDVNQNFLPRGGIVVSLGSTPGLGYAPLVGAKVRATVNSGQITSLVGIATTGPSIGIDTAFYDSNTGILSVTTLSAHGLSFTDSEKDTVRLNGLSFIDDSSSATFPSISNNSFSVIRKRSDTKFDIRIGQSISGVNTYTGNGVIMPYYDDLTFGSGYNNLVGISVTITDSTGVGASITAQPVGFNTYRLLSIEKDLSTSNGNLDKNLINVGLTTYYPNTGILHFNTTTNHGLSNSSTVTIATDTFKFSCAQDNYSTEHLYPRSTDPVVGIATPVTFIDATNFTVNVGTAPAHGGGRLEFTIVNGGSGYSDNPNIQVSEPSYERLAVTGVSRRDIGATTQTGTGLRINAVVGPSTFTTGPNNEFSLYEVTDFKVVVPGYSYKLGDVVTAVGLVTDRRLKELNNQFQLEVTQELTDDFGMWQFGEVDYIDPIKSLQDGIRTRFPLKKNGELLSIEASPDYVGDLKNILFVMRNGVLQDPDNYDFIGGTSVKFGLAPRASNDDGDTGDEVEIFFYKGTDKNDVIERNKDLLDFEPGDEIQLKKSPSIKKQDSRVFYGIKDSNTAETNLYIGDGINSEIFRSTKLIKQKNTRIVNGITLTKVRETLEPKITPSAKIISSIYGTGTENYVYVDDARLFDYESRSGGSGIEDDPVTAIIVSGATNPVAAAITATVGTSGTITEFTVNDGGSGYTGFSPTVKIAAPPQLDYAVNEFSIDEENDFAISVETTTNYSGIGSTATATATVSATGTISNVSVVNPGFGYSANNPPRVIVNTPSISYEEVTDLDAVYGVSGPVIGIGTTTVGSNLALKFTLKQQNQPYDGFASAEFYPIQQGSPIYIFGTTIGSGSTSLESDGTTLVGIGTTFLDNIYYVSEFSKTGATPATGIITCIVENDSSITGLVATGTTANPVGGYSLGLITSFSRSSSPISIGVTGFTVDAGLSTFPSINRNGGDSTFRDGGHISINISQAS